MTVRAAHSFCLRLVLALWIFVGVGDVWAQGNSVFALRTMLRDKEPGIRIKAAQGLGRVGGPRSVQILREGLADKTTEVRVAAVAALGYIGGRLARNVLAEALRDKQATVRLRAVEALKEAGTVSSIPLLQKAFGDREESVRLHAALMLRRIGHRNGVPVLGRAALNDKSPAVREAATGHLGKVGVKDPRAVGLLARVLDDPETAVRLRAIESLGFLQLRASIPVLERALADPVPGVRIRATEVLGRVLAKDFE